MLPMAHHYCHPLVHLHTIWMVRRRYMVRGQVAENDVVIAISNSGETKEMIATLQVLKIIMPRL